MEWANVSLKGYREPTRSGKRRGDRIGFPRKKQLAAFLMVLHPSFNLSEIARLAGVSGGLIRVWRTEPEFRKVTKTASSQFTKRLINTIEMKAESKKRGDPARKPFFEGYDPLTIAGRKDFSVDDLTRIVTFFDLPTQKMFLNFLEEKSYMADFFVHYLNVFVTWMEAIGVIYFPTLRKLLRDDPWYLNMYKRLLAFEILALKDPEFKGIRRGQTAELADSLKDTVWGIIDAWVKG